MYQRMFVLLLALIVWHLTQTFLMSDIIAKQKIIDRSHDFVFFKTINDFMKEHTEFTRYNFILTSLLIDINVVYICIKYLMGGNRRSIFIFFVGLILRQICQFTNRLPTPNDMIWFHPGIPSMLVTYYVQNDFFFSGHTYVAFCAGLEIISSKNFWAKFYGILFIVYEIMLIITTNSHYFMDVYGAVATYFMLSYFYDRYIK